MQGGSADLQGLLKTLLQKSSVDSFAQLNKSAAIPVSLLVHSSSRFDSVYLVNRFGFPKKSDCSIRAHSTSCWSLYQSFRTVFILYAGVIHLHLLVLFSFRQTTTVSLIQLTQALIASVVTVTYHNFDITVFLMSVPFSLFNHVDDKMLRWFRLMVKWFRLMPSFMYSE